MISFQSIFLAAIILISTSVIAKDSRIPKDSPIPYYPSTAAAIVIAAVSVILGAVILFRLLRHRARWGLCLPIAIFFSALGWILRIPLQTSSGTALYAVVNILIVLPPTVYIAFNYLLFGRMLVALDPALRKDTRLRTRSEFSWMPPRLVSRVFIASDVFTFLFQANGGSLQAIGDPFFSKMGNIIFLVGIATQAVSYILFTTLFVYTAIRLHQRDHESFNLLSYRTGHPLVRLFQALIFSSIFIIIRSIYRTIELADGYEGKLYNTEIYLIVLDAIPMIIAALPWMLIWPSQRLQETESLSERGNTIESIDLETAEAKTLIGPTENTSPQRDYGYSLPR